jgi:hypothetical protein
LVAALVLVAMAALVAGTRTAGAQQPEPSRYYDPGWNLYSPQQDIQVGKQAEQQELKHLPILHNPAAERYFTHLGDTLAAHMPGPKWPFNFHLVAQKDINAFALPGGPVFVNVGAVCAARNEAQLAGVMAHEESHVALRHSTSSASKKQVVSVPLSILGAIFNSGAGQIADVAAQMVAGGVFLKYSRDMESQADALGAQVMNAAGYDPRQMAQFFEILEAQGGSGTVQFLSDHPNPGNRQAAIEQEIPTLGSHPAYHDNSAEFATIHSQLCADHTPRASVVAAAPAKSVAQGSQPKSVPFQGVVMAPPHGWTVYGEQTSQLTIVPPNGLDQQGGQTSVVRGVIVSTYAGSLAQLIAELQRANPNLQPVTGTEAGVKAGDLSGSALTLTNRNASNAAETDRLLVFPGADHRLLYFILIAPSSEYRQHTPAFDQLLRSLRRP